MSSKACTKCGVLDRYPSGACKPCDRVRKASYKLKNREAISARNRARYRATRTEETRRLDSEHSRKYYLKNRDKIQLYNRSRKLVSREWALRKKYGLTLADYERMLAEQDSKCDICKSPDPKTHHGHFTVDHCHKTGAIRALLCDRCNKGLGFFDDDVDLMDAAREYVRRRAA